MSLYPCARSCDHEHVLLLKLFGQTNQEPKYISKSVNGKKEPEVINK